MSTIQTGRILALHCIFNYVLLNGRLKSRTINDTHTHSNLLYTKLTIHFAVFFKIVFDVITREQKQKNKAQLHSTLSLFYVYVLTIFFGINR